MITPRYFIAVKENSVPVTKDSQLALSLQTPRLLLKGLMADDGAAFFGYRSHPEVTRFQGFAPETVEDAVRFIEEDICHEMNRPGTWFQWGIFLREGQTLIGDLGIHFLPEESSVEIGVTIAPDFQGKGFATEAMGCVMGFLFDTLGKSKVVASVDPKNLKSMALMKRTGFELEGIYKNTVLFRGEWADDAVFSMTRKQWQNRPKPNL
jgi:RimJ/RimL family protein N-acetyltransferase